ncbi:MAG: YebC/PmpR family DNA-binding transcriptional regulator [Candidatus Komeilibacteria bacterium]|nr:YebC/PmpR family DNA-binding transcriptional regulator [Candidatus Komeilibacteria bacterium]
MPSAPFTKIARLITVAARGGADPTMNFKLRIAIDKAKEGRMPKENIERAIARGAGTAGGEVLDELTYEGFGSEKISVIIEVITDNKNRSAMQIKKLLADTGGSLGGPNSVMWQFDHKGVIQLGVATLTEEQELSLIEVGADDFQSHEDQTIVYCALIDFENVKKKIAELNLPLIEANLEYVPKEKIKVQDEEKMGKFFEALDENDDINNFYTNADF